jgi:hypothetical protein
MYSYVYGTHPQALPLLPLDAQLVVTPDAFRAAWDALQSCGAFSVRVTAVPPAAVIAAHLRRQCFAVVASGMIAGRTKVHTKYTVVL